MIEKLKKRKNWLSCHCVSFGKETTVGIINDREVLIQSSMEDGEEVYEIPFKEKTISVCYGNGMYVAIPYDTDYIYYSYEDLQWKKIELPKCIVSSPLSSVTYAFDKFMAVSDSGEIIVSDTNDVTKWTRVFDGYDTEDTFDLICFNGDTAIVSNPRSSSILLSTCGEIWNMIKTDLSQCLVINGVCLQNLCVIDGVFIGQDYISNILVSSKDGINWDYKSSTRLPNYEHITYLDGVVILSSQYAREFMYSEDMVDWFEKYFDDPSINDQKPVDIAFNKFHLVIPCEDTDIINLRRRDGKIIIDINSNLKEMLK